MKNVHYIAMITVFSGTVIGKFKYAALLMQMLCMKNGKYSVSR